MKLYTPVTGMGMHLPNEHGQPQMREATPSEVLVEAARLCASEGASNLASMRSALLYAAAEAIDREGDRIPEPSYHGIALACRNIAESLEKGERG